MKPDLEYQVCMRKSQSKGKKVETKMLEEETKRMEEKLLQLKKQMQSQKTQRTEVQESGSRWKQSSTNVPLRGYATKLIEDQKQLFKKHGFTSTGLFTKRPPSQHKPESEIQNKALIELPTQATEDSIQTNQFLQNKFGKAIIQAQSLKTSGSVQQMLQSLGLVQYIPVFEELHIDDLELINKGLLQQMDMAPGHKIKILRRIKEQGSQEKKSQAIIVDTLSMDQSLEHDKEDGDRTQEAQQLEEGGRLLEGQYDQEQNARDFQAALEAYRGVYQKIQDISLQTDRVSVPKALRQVCFNCYRTFLTEPFRFSDRVFCSSPCLKKYYISRFNTCPKCQKVFNKTEGFCHQGIRYCRIQCSPDIKTVEELFVKWRVQDRVQP